jgi:hypothetical protein
LPLFTGVWTAGRSGADPRRGRVETFWKPLRKDTRLTSQFPGALHLAAPSS